MFTDNVIECYFNESNSDYQSALINSSDQVIDLENWIQMRNYSDVIDCASLFHTNSSHITVAKEMTKRHPRRPIEDIHFINLTRNCEKIKRKRGYITEMNHSFPIAYSILFYKELEQVEYLLRAIYRPQNIYCLHLDKFYSKV